MTFRLRGVELPEWTTKTGLATNKVWLEFLRREIRMEKTRVEYEVAVAYALAGSPEAPAKDRFELVDPPKDTYIAHLNGRAYQTSHKRKVLERRRAELQAKQAEMARVDWLGSAEFNLSDWMSGK